MSGRERIRVIVAKVGLDGHDRGVKIVARTLRDAGMDVIYTGLHRTPEEVVDAAIQEDVDVVGVSSSVEGHLPVAREVTRRLAAQGRADVLVLFGGVIPERDFPAMRELGVEGVFGPGSTADSVIAFVRERARAVRPRFA